MYVRKINIEEDVEALFAQWALLLTHSAQKNIFRTLAHVHSEVV